MKKYCGKSVFKGIAIGKVHVYEKDDSKVKRVHTEDTDAEKQKFENSRAEAKNSWESFIRKHLMRLDRLML